MQRTKILLMELSKGELGGQSLKSVDIGAQHQFVVLCKEGEG